jgi:hypothetical protein
VGGREFEGWLKLSGDYNKKENMKAIGQPFGSLFL